MRPSDRVSAAGGAEPESSAHNSSVARRISKRLAVHAAQFRTELLQRRVGLVGLLAPLLDLATLLFDLRRQASLLGGQPFALGPRFFFQELTVGGQLLVELLQGRPLRFQFRFRLGQALLPLGQGFGLAADRFFLQDDGLGRLGRLFQLGVSFFQPEPGRPGVAFQLCGPSIEFGLAMIEFLLPAAEVLGKLRRLGLDLPRDRLGVGRRRGRLFAAPRLQIDAARPSRPPRQRPLPRSAPHWQRSAANRCGFQQPVP